jgi:cytoskeletal protein CcmA (bactofilin family)
MGIFSSQSSSNGPDRPGPPPSGERRRARDPQGGLSIVARDLTIAGDLQAEGVIRIEGRVVGNVHAGDQVLLSEGAIVEGDIVAREAVIGGRVHGSITGGERVELQTSAIVHGDIVTRRLLIQEGGSVNGSMKMEGELVQSAVPESIHVAVNG